MENQDASYEKISPNSNGVVKQFYQDAIQVLTEPTRFFKTRFDSMTFNQALVFGLVISWISAFAEWLTRVVKHESLMDSFMKLKEQLQQLPFWKDLPANIWAQGNATANFLPEWGMEGLKMLINPFHTLILFFISGVVFWLGATVLVSNANTTRTSVTITNVVKITAVSAATSLVAAILSFLPFGIGGFFGWLFHLAILTIGFSERFQVSRPRGLAVVLLPSIIALVFFSCFIGIVIALFAGIFMSLFH